MFFVGPFSFLGWARRCTKGSGRIASQERPVGEFHGVRIKGVGIAHLTQHPRCRVRVEADDNIVDRVTTTVQDGLLVIELESGSYRDVTVDVHVSSPRIDTVWISGQGEIVTDAPIDTPELLCRISGSGVVKLSGAAKRQTVHLSGMGKVRNAGLSSSRCSVKLSGMGDCRVDVHDELDAKVSGAGRITYSGRPAVVRKIVSGMGAVQPAE